MFLRCLPLFLVLGPTAIFASPTPANNAFPRGCEVVGFGYQQNHLILNDTGHQTLYLIQNRSDVPIALENVETADVFMAPKLEAQILPHFWAAFSSNEANQHFKCMQVSDDQLQDIDCATTLDVCQYPRVKFALSNQGNYWISTNKPQQQVIHEAASKGIYLKW